MWHNCSKVSINRPLQAKSLRFCLEFKVNSNVAIPQMSIGGWFQKGGKFSIDSYIERKQLNTKNKHIQPDVKTVLKVYGFCLF